MHQNQDFVRMLEKQIGEALAEVTPALMVGRLHHRNAKSMLKRQVNASLGDAIRNSSRLGLTESLQVGYQRSPRSEVVSERLNF